MSSETYFGVSGSRNCAIIRIESINKVMPPKDARNPNWASARWVFFVCAGQVFSLEAVNLVIVVTYKSKQLFAQDTCFFLIPLRCYLKAAGISFHYFTPMSHIIYDPSNIERNFLRRLWIARNLKTFILHISWNSNKQDKRAKRKSPLKVSSLSRVLHRSLHR